MSSKFVKLEYHTADQYGVRIEVNKVPLPMFALDVTALVDCYTLATMILTLTH